MLLLSACCAVANALTFVALSLLSFAIFGTDLGVSSVVAIILVACGVWLYSKGSPQTKVKTDAELDVDLECKGAGPAYGEDQRLLGRRLGSQQVAVASAAVLLCFLLIQAYTIRYAILQSRLYTGEAKKEATIKKHMITQHDNHASKECNKNVPSFMVLLKYVAQYHDKETLEDVVDGNVGPS